ncbi:MAG: MarR family transcriptional regulator [Anaerolineales bacterium]|nr:MarR family transcriptional regulator [Anaerolineales bacterium]
MPPHPEPQTLDFLLAQVSRLHHQRAHELLEGLGLYRGQPPVLFALWEQAGLTHSELAERLGISSATITKMLQRMEKAGFVKRQPDAGDQRVSRVYLTKAGRAVHSKLEAIFQQMEIENFNGFSDDERVVLRTFLLRLRKNLEQAIQGKIPC